MACIGDSSVLLTYDVRSKSRRSSLSQAFGFVIIPTLQQKVMLEWWTSLWHFMKEVLERKLL